MLELELVMTKQVKLVLMICIKSPQFSLILVERKMEKRKLKIILKYHHIIVLDLPYFTYNNTESSIAKANTSVKNVLGKN